MKKVLLAAIIATSLQGAVARTEEVPARGRALTEWRLPFRNATASEIAADEDFVYYFGSSGEFPITQLGRLDVERNIVTEWSLPFLPTHPGDLAIRADGTVFLTNLEFSEIGQFDPAMERFKRWAAPAWISGGPRSLAFDQNGLLYFTASSTETGTFIARLDTATDTITAWRLPESVAVASSMDFAECLSLSADGIFFNVNGFAHRAIVRFEPTTGVFTSWPVNGNAMYATAADGAGNVYFHEIGSGFRRFARLEVASGRLTEWDLPGNFGSDLVFQAGRLFGTLTQTPGALLALNPRAPGSEGVLYPTTSEPVAPETVAAPPTLLSDPPRRTRRALARRTPMRRTQTGAFTAWEVSWGEPDFLAGDGDKSLYFTASDRASIGRLR